MSCATTYINYIQEVSTEEVMLEDCALGEWIFQGNRILSTLDLGQCPWWSLNLQRQSPLFQDFKMKNWLSRRRIFWQKMFISLNSCHIMQQSLIPVISLSSKIPCCWPLSPSGWWLKDAGGSSGWPPPPLHDSHWPWHPGSKASKATRAAHQQTRLPVESGF